MKKWFMMIVGGLALMAGSVTSSLAALLNADFLKFVDDLTANTLVDADLIAASLEQLSPEQVNNTLISIRGLTGDLKSTVTDNFFNGYIEVLKDPEASKSDAAVATLGAFSLDEIGTFDKLIEEVAKADPKVGSVISTSFVNVFAEALKDNVLTVDQIDKTFSQIETNKEQLASLFAALTPGAGADDALKNSLAQAATRLVVAVASEADDPKAAATLVLSGFSEDKRDVIAAIINDIPAGGGLAIGPVVEGAPPTITTLPPVVADVADTVIADTFVPIELDRPISPA